MMNDTRTVSKKERNSMEEKELTSTAYHEAGHAFAYWLTGKEFDRVTISPDGKGLGEIATNYMQKRGWRSSTPTRSTADIFLFATHEPTSTTSTFDAAG